MSNCRERLNAYAVLHCKPAERGWNVYRNFDRKSRIATETRWLVFRKSFQNRRRLLLRRTFFLSSFSAHASYSSASELRFRAKFISLWKVPEGLANAR